jgi:beta-lactamase superfamily II metal-dependent hydrolase
MPANQDEEKKYSVHFLDMGDQIYGDAILCQIGSETILIDGGHPNDYSENALISDQLKEILQTDPPFEITLLIISHVHDDHIGCLPTAVENEEIKFKYALVPDEKLGFGRLTKEDDNRDAFLSDNLRAVIAIMQEEPLPLDIDETILDRMIEDAKSIEDRYIQFLKDLKKAGTKIYRYGKNNINPLLKHFKKIGLKVLGPSAGQMKRCAEIISKSYKDAMLLLKDRYGDDRIMDAVTLYNILLESGKDALDSINKASAAKNNQSLVVRFDYLKQKALFAGDMQFSIPSLSQIKDDMKALRESMRKDAPFNFVKISHHGSHNAFSEDIYLEDYKDTKIFGISLGRGDENHPAEDVLECLEKNQDAIYWFRTDKNGSSTLIFNPDKSPEIECSRGEINDAAPNVSDLKISSPAQTLPLEPVVSSTSLPEVSVVPSPAPLDSHIEIITRIPNQSTIIKLTIEVQPGAAPPEILTKDASPLKDINLAGGRNLPHLLFITSHEGLASIIGKRETGDILKAIRNSGHIVLDTLPSNMTQVQPLLPIVRKKIEEDNSLAGVVIIGSYNVVPSQIFDVLDTELRAKIGASDDDDNFIIWSDDAYVDLKGDSLPELPISRVPDGGSAEFLRTVLESGCRLSNNKKFGIRNSKRPFANKIYRLLPGSQSILVSEPTLSNTLASEKIMADSLYFMLHGWDEDKTKFWGETKMGEYITAFELKNVPRINGSVVFSGCCWGALISEKPAFITPNNSPVKVVKPEESIAMTFLKAGVRAFIGCTGTHYSPVEPPYNFFGGPMHEAFWRHYVSGKSPAQSLFDAKKDYAMGIPHGQNDFDKTTQLSYLSIERKILHEFTCLGLGW